MSSNFKGNFDDDDFMSKFNDMARNMGAKPNQKVTVVNSHIDGIPNLFGKRKQNVNQFNMDDFDNESTFEIPKKSANAKSNDNKKFDLDTFRKECLDAHNKKRRLHKAADLTRNSELDKIAQNYAQQLADTNSFEHSSNTYKGDNLGENLFMQGGRAMTGDYAVDSWYSEIKNYNFQNPRKRSGVVGHFTQLVWKGSKEVGIGCGVSSNGSYYVVANYYPAGNWVGEESQNVFPQ
jgi:glioma pathogenesis-related protein 2